MTALANLICAGCKKPIGTTDGCTDEGYPFVIDGRVQWLSAVAYGDPREDWGDITTPERCHDCGVLTGEVHHWGCDFAQCPNCDQHLLGDCRIPDELEPEGDDG